MTLLRMDLRDLSAPEPMERILQCLQTLARGQRLVALTPFKPVPLLPILDQQGFAYRMGEHREGGACIVICHAEDQHALHPPRAP